MGTTDDLEAEKGNAWDAVLAVRGFARAGDVAVDPGATSGIEILDVTGAHVGFAAPVDRRAGGSLFEDIRPLTSAERTSTLVRLDECEGEILRLAKQRDPQEFARILEESGLAADDGESAGESRSFRAQLACAIVEDADPGSIDPEIQGLWTEARECRELVFRDSIRLAASVAQRHRHSFDWAAALLSAAVGLAIALDRFEPSMGNQFSTYATYWIRQSVGRHRSNHARPLRLPVHAGERATKVLRCITTLWAELERLPTRHEIASNVDGASVEKVAEWMRPALPSAVSRDPSEHAWAEFVLDSSRPSPGLGGTGARWVERVERELLAQFFGAARGLARGSESKTARFMDILQARSGLGRPDRETLQEVGDRYGITRERIRQQQELLLTALRQRGRLPPARAPWMTVDDG